MIMGIGLGIVIMRIIGRGLRVRLKECGKVIMVIWKMGWMSGLIRIKRV